MSYAGGSRGVNAVSAGDANGSVFTAVGLDPNGEYDFDEVLGGGIVDEVVVSAAAAAVLDKESIAAEGEDHWSCADGVSGIDGVAEAAEDIVAGGAYNESFDDTGATGLDPNGEYDFLPETAEERAGGCDVPVTGGDSTTGCDGVIVWSAPDSTDDGEGGVYRLSLLAATGFVPPPPNGE